MSAPASTEDLLSSFRNLRSDPVVASVLRGDPDTSGGFRLPTSSPTRSAVADQHRQPTSAKQPPGSAASIQELNSSMSDALLRATATSQDKQHFYKDRDVSRDSVGVTNWLQKHRDELSQSDAKRLENRLRAEKLFAQSQVDVEKFRLDAERQRIRNKDAGADVAIVSVGGGRDAAKSPERSTQTDLVVGADDLTGDAEAATKLEQLLLERQSSIPSSHAAPPTQQQQHRPPASFVSPVMDELRLLHQTTGFVRRLDTEEAFGPIDVEANYRNKASQLVPDDGKDVADDVATGNPSQQHQQHRFYASGTFGREGGISTNALVVAGGAPGGSDGELMAVRAAVQQRDTTIHRLERQLAADRDYYEQEISRLKSEAHEERLAAEARISALRVQIDQLVTVRAGKNAHETTIEELTIKLQTVQRMYRTSLEELKERASASHDALERACESRVKEISSRAEEAIRNAKQAFLVERSQYFAQQKTALVETVQREQSLLLREAEDELTETIMTSVRDKLSTEIELAFRKHLEADITPAVRERLFHDSCVRALEVTRATLDGLVAQKSLELQAFAASHVNEKFLDLQRAFEKSAKELMRKLGEGTLELTKLPRLASDDRSSSSPFSHLPPEPDAPERAPPSNPSVAADEAVVVLSLLPPTETLSQFHREHKALRATVAALADEEERQKRLDDLHQEKVSIYRKRVQQMELSMQSEASFAAHIRSQVSSRSLETEESERLLSKEDRVPPVPSSSFSSLKAQQQVSKDGTAAAAATIISSGGGGAAPQAPPWAVE